MMKRRHLSIQSVYIHMTLILRIRKTKFFFIRPVSLNPSVSVKSNVYKY